MSSDKYPIYQKTMIKDLIKFFILISCFSAVLLAIHYYIGFNFFSGTELFFPLWSIYAFNMVLVLVVYGIIYFKTNRGNTKTYQQFLILSLIKMGLVIAFLTPLFFGKSENSTLEVLNFFIPYFLFLAFEIVTISKFLNHKETK